MDRYQKELKLVLDMQDKASAEIKRVNQHLDKLQKQSGTATKKMDKQFQGLAKTFGKVAAGAAAAYAAIKSIQKGYELAKLAAQAKQTNFAFDVMTKNIGANSQAIIKSLKEMSANTVSELDLVTSATRAMMFEIPVDEMDRLMQIARASATALGTDVKSMFDDIVTGISRQSRMILDNLGIVVSLDKSYENYAETLGKTVKQLSDAEKKQAFLNGVLKEGDRIIRQVGDAASELTDLEKFQQMSSAIDDLKVAVGERLKPAFLGISNIITGWVTKLTKTIELHNQIRDIEAQGGPKTVADYEALLKDLREQRFYETAYIKTTGVKDANISSMPTISKLNSEIAELTNIIAGIQQNQANIDRRTEVDAHGRASSDAEKWTNLRKVQEDAMLNALNKMAWKRQGAGFGFAVGGGAESIIEATVQKMLGLGFSADGQGVANIRTAGANWLQGREPLSNTGYGINPTTAPQNRAGVFYPGMTGATNIESYASGGGQWKNYNRGGFLEKAGGAVGGGIMQIFGGFGKQIQGIMQLLQPVQIILNSMLKILMPLIEKALAPLFGIFVLIGEVLAKALVPILEILTPVIEILVKIFQALLTPIIMVIAAFEWLVKKVKSWFGGSKPGSFGSYVSNAANEWLGADAGAAGLEYMGDQGMTDGGPVGAGAQYTQARDINIQVNVYTAALVGEGGIDELALLIGNRLDDLQAVGVI